MGNNRRIKIIKLGNFGHDFFTIHLHFTMELYSERTRSSLRAIILLAYLCLLVAFKIILRTQQGMELGNRTVENCTECDLKSPEIPVYQFI